MRPSAPPPPTFAFRYHTTPRSGNEINGLGESEKVRARHVFHNATGETLPWDALDNFFSYINPWGVFRHLLANSWQLRRRDGPVAPTRREIDDPDAMAREIKTAARNLGAGIVGIARITDDALYEGRNVPFRYAICIGMPMERGEMQHVPHPQAAVEVMRVYRLVSRVAIELSEHIRRMGWPARAYGNPNSTDLLHIPLAVSAGLGQLGKHGSLITRAFGSNVRLACVVTDLPLAVDRPVDIAVDDLCLSCRRCTLDCPPDAISDAKQLVRGQRRWYVDFDKCIPYFVKTLGCAICIQVCPWSEPGRGPALSERLLARRAGRQADDSRTLASEDPSA